jgi:K+-sensing histidine kinase KdpD
VGFVTKNRSTFSRYAAAILITPVILYMFNLLRQIDPDGHLSVVNILGVLVVVCWGGLWPGVVAAILVSIGTDYYFIQPVGEIFTSATGVIQLAIYLSISLITGGVVAALRHSLQKENELKEFAEKCAEADRNVLYIVNHDLKSPLTGIAMKALLLRRQLQEKISPSQRELFESIDQSIVRMTRIIDDLQEAGKIESGHFSTDVKDCELNTLIEESIFSFRDRAEAKKIKIQLLADKTLPKIRSDGARVLQVISNFLSNAIKFAPEKSQVNIQISKEGDNMKVSVTNAGEGIPESHLPHVFDRHWQAEETKHLGMGLGLYIAKIIIQSLNGKIGVENHSGPGCTFFFLLPIDGAQADH